MAMVMTRNHQRTPAIYPEDQEQFGIYTPTQRRASLPASQRNASRPKQADSRSDNNADIQTNAPRITDALDLAEEDEGPATSREPILITSRRGNGDIITPPPPGRQKVTYSPQAHRSIWKVIFTVVSTILTVLFVLYTVVFLIVTGWIMVSNAWQYGQAHAASTQTVIDGTPTTIITSNINHTIYITIISKDGLAKAYTGPTLDANSWGGDLGSVIATASVGQGHRPTITVALIGSVNYLRPPFVRPQSSFSLVPDKQGYYKVVQS